MRISTVALVALCATSVAAQEVTGTVRTERDQSPVAGAIVILTSPAGAKVGATLTGDDGTFRLRAPTAGRFALRVDVVGFESVTIPLFQLDSGTVVTRDARFPFARVRLPTVAVTATSACSRVSGDAGDAPRLWSEARKALEATQLAIDEQRVLVALHRFERTIGPDSVLRAARTWTQTAVSQNPFETLPAETIARVGYKVERDTGLYYYAPDAAVLLSDTFVEGHCFGTRRDGPAGSLGLTFRPQRTTRLTDISGVLWLDSASAELRSLEYRYVPSVGAPNVGGGFVAFGRLPSGLWGVQRWSIRLPVLQVTESRRRPDGALGRFVDTMTVAVHEVGGEVIAGGAAGSTGAPMDGRLVGTVFDSTLGAPLPGAMVTIEGIGRTVQADDSGAFVVDSLAEDGEFRIRVWHPRIDSLGYAAPVTRHRLRRRGQNVANLTVPGIGAVARDRCGRTATAVERVVMGTLRAANDSTSPLASMDVVLLERRGPGTGGADGLVRHDDVTSDMGRYAFCEARPGSQTWLIARVGSEWTDPYLVSVDSAPPVEIVAIQASTTAGTTADSVAVGGAPAVILGRTLHGDAAARVSGWVVLPEQMEARVEILVDNVVRTTTAKDGSFTLDSVPPGIRRITFRANRLAIRHLAVTAELGQTHLLLVALREAPLVVVQRNQPDFDQRMAEFRRRRRAGGGVFLDRAEIERRGPRTLTDLMRTIPGVRVQASGSVYRYVSGHFRSVPSGSESDNSGYCDMLVYLNGQPFLAESGSADARVAVSEIAGLEVYLSAASVPREFAGPTSACGVIVIWLGR